MDASASEDCDEGQHLIKCPNCPRPFKRPSGLAPHERAYHRTQQEDAPNSDKADWTGPSLQSPNKTTEACNTQQSADLATSPRTPRSASDCSAEVFPHRPSKTLKKLLLSNFMYESDWFFHLPATSSFGPALTLLLMPCCNRNARALIKSLLTIDTKSNTKKDRDPQSVRKLKETTKFRADPFKCGKQIFRPKSTVQPEFDKDTATKFFAEDYADKQR